MMNEHNSGHGICFFLSFFLPVVASTSWPSQRNIVRALKGDMATSDGDGDAKKAERREHEHEREPSSLDVLIRS
jgi:hypothetical protein